MSKSLFIDTNITTQKKNELKEQVTNIENLLGRVKLTLASISNHWDSPNATTCIANSNRLAQTFDTINKKDNDYVLFLEQVISAYTKLDQELLKKVQDESQNLSINGS